MQTTIEQSHHRLGNGHVHPQTLGALPDGAGAVDAFGHVTERGHGLRKAQTLGQQQAHFAVAAQIACGRQNQIPQARQAHEGLGLGTQRYTQAGHFGQTPGNEGCAGVQPQVQAIAQTRGDGQHVFDGPTHLNTHDVFIGIHTQRPAMEGLDQRLTHRCMRAGRHQSGRLGSGHFLRETGAIERASAQLRGNLGLHFVGHETCLSLEALAQPSHRRGHAAQRQQSAAQTRHGGGDDEEVFGPGRLQPCVQRARGDAQRCGQVDAGQVALVAALLLQGLGLGRITRMQNHPVCGRVSAGRNGQRSAPGACTDDGDLHAGCVRNYCWVAAAWACCCSYMAWKLISARCTGGKPARVIRSATLPRR